jgi:hypothetical protein
MKNYNVNMLIYLPNKKVFSNRKQIKQYLGGANAYNKAFRNKQIFYTDNNISDNQLKVLIANYYENNISK